MILYAGVTLLFYFLDNTQTYTKEYVIQDVSYWQPSTETNKTP